MTVRADGSVVTITEMDPAPALSVPGSVRLYYDTNQQTILRSENGGPYLPIASGGGSSTALAQPTWYVDPITGSDANDGATAATALATWAEYARRVGSGPPTVAQTVNLLSDLSEDLIISCSYPLGLTVQGKRTVIYSGTVSAATTWNTTTSPIVPGSITDAGLPADWIDSGPAGSSLVGKLFVMTSGANVGKWGYILKDLTGKVARVPQLINAAFATGAPAVGNSFDVVDLTKISGRVVLRNGDINQTDLGVTFVDCWISNAASPLTANEGVILFVSCILQQTTNFGYPWGASGTSLGCLFAMRLYMVNVQSWYFSGDSFDDASIQAQTSYLGFFFQNVHQAQNGGVQANANLLSVYQGSQVEVAFGSYGGLDVQTAGQSIVAVQSGGLFTVDAGARCWGFNQSNGFGCFIDSFGQAEWGVGATAPASFEFDISGGAVEFELGGTPTDAAALGAAGTINASNNAGAVVQTS